MCVCLDGDISVGVECVVGRDSVGFARDDTARDDTVCCCGLTEGWLCAVHEWLHSWVL